MKHLNKKCLFKKMLAKKQKQKLNHFHGDQEDALWKSTANYDKNDVRSL